MDGRTTGIAFAVLAAGVVWLGWSGQERYEAARAERATLADAPSDEGGLTPEDRTGISLVLMGAAGAALFWLRLIAFQKSGAVDFRILFGLRPNPGLRAVLDRALGPLLMMAAAAACAHFFT